MLIDKLDVALAFDFGNNARECVASAILQALNGLFLGALKACVFELTPVVERECKVRLFVE